MKSRYTISVGKLFPQAALILIVFMLLGGHPIALVGQTILPEECTVYRPLALTSNLIKETDIQAFLKTGRSKKSTAWGQTSNTGLYWTVYSDRSANTTYESPQEGSSKYKELEFGQELRIAEIKNGYALVYKDNNSGVTYPTISRNATSYGWVPMTHLLLWTDCPTNESYIYRKVFIYRHVKQNSSLTSLCSYTSPTKADGKEAIPAYVDFYYLMKEENGMVLLSKESRVSGKEINMLYGWVSKESCFIWDNRVCIEPNWDPYVVQDLTGKQCPIYDEIGKVITNFVFNYPKNNVSTCPETIYRLNPNVMRFIVTEVDTINKRYGIFGFRKDINHNVRFNISFKGHVPQKSSNGWDYWKPVVYISHPEFLKLMEQLTPVMEAVENNPDDRKPYVDAMKGLVSSMLPGVSEQMMMKMDNKEIMAQIFGLNVKTEALEKYPLVDIENVQAVTPEKFSGLVSDFMVKYRKLEKIIKKNYPFTTKRNGVPFYWIPVEDLP